MAVIGYSISALYSVFLYRRGFRQDNRVNYFILLTSFVPHTVAMVMRGFTLARCPVNNLYEAMTFIMWTILASYLVIGVWRRLRFLGAFASPVLLAMGVFALMPALDTPHGPAPVFKGGLASLHASLILLSYGAFGLSFVAAIMFLSQEHDLKFHKLRAVISKLPPIERLEKVINRLLVAGFFLLTVGLALAPFITSDKTGLWRDPKTLWSVFVWVLYGGLLGMRWYFSHGGRKFAWGAIGGFSFVLLTFWGFNLLSSIHNP